MANYNKQKPGHRAQLNQYLTRRGPTKVGSELRKQSLEKAIEDKTKELSEDKITTQNKKSPDILRNILVNKLIYDGEESLDEGEKAYLHYTKPREQTKPFVQYKKGEAKIIIDELKRQKRKANPVLNTDLKIKLDTIPVYIPTSPTEDPETERLRLKVEENERKNKQQKLKAKYSGLGAYDNRYSDE